MRVAYGNSNVLRCSVQLAMIDTSDYNYDQAHGFAFDDGTGENIPVTTQIGKNLPSNPQGFSGYTERNFKLL